MQEFFSLQVGEFLFTVSEMPESGSKDDYCPFFPKSMGHTEEKYLKMCFSEAGPRSDM